MSAQRISEKKLRQVAAITSLDLKHAVANGGNVYILTTVDHQHHAYDTRTHQVVPVELDTHYSSCPGGSTDDGNWTP